jgi:hypothetical protein
MTVISLDISRWLETTRAAISEIQPARTDRARPRLFALLVGGAVACASLVATASVNSADARPGYGGGHGHGGHGYGSGHGYGGHGYGGGNWYGGHRYGGHAYSHGYKPYWGHGYSRYYWGRRYAAYGFAPPRCKDLPRQQLGNVVCSGSVPLKPLPEQ